MRQLIFQLRRNCIQKGTLYHSFMKTPNPKYLFIIKYMSNLHNLLMGVNGFVRQKLLLTTIYFYILFYFQTYIT